MQVESLILELKQIPELQDVAMDISRRLPHMIRYNILSVETCPELLSHPGPGGHADLSGVGLYHLPSFFNHSATPNCSRWAVGDVMGFVANQDITKGNEVCISYIEHDVLCESAYRRNLMLRMDFDDGGSESFPPSLAEQQGPDVPVVDSDVQNELMAMDPFERLKSIDELMEQALGAKRPDGETEQDLELKGKATKSLDEAARSTWFQCDIHNLRILKALTMDALGQTLEALKLWEESVAFAESKLPPLDESTVVLRAQAALCALHAGQEARARNHSEIALRVHHLLFGGGVARFRRRFEQDLILPLRPGSRSNNNTPLGNNDRMVSPASVLWPL